MLSDKIKKKIRTIHKAISENLPHYQPRKQQNYLVAEIAKTLAGEYDKERRICIIEAGTGTGKSLAYCLGSIPLAMVQEKKVVISTATVALQEQLVSKDLPFFAKHAELDFSFDIIKGRQRYACATKLATFIEDDDAQLDFSQLLLQPPNDTSKALLHKLAKAYNTKKWDGDRDNYKTVIPDSAWQHIVSDKHSCSRSLPEHRRCPFQLARERIGMLDVLIVNHALLLADLELGGGVIISDPEDSIYIIDEGHHLPKITRDFSSAQATVKGAREWLDKLPKLVQQFSKTLTSSKSIGITHKIEGGISESSEALNQVYQWLQQNHHELFKDNDTVRFENGEIPGILLLHAETLSPATDKMVKQLQKLQELLKEEVNDGAISPSLSEPLFTDLGFFLHRCENLNKLWDQLAYVKSEKAPPNARWIEAIKQKNNQIDYLIATSPLEVGFVLADKLWSKCAGAVVCSATLTALNKFDFFRHQAGLLNNDGTQYIQVPSPFNYQQNATLMMPALACEPTAKEFTDELIRVIPGLLEGQSASLVLFSSYWQMQSVAEALRSQHKLELLVQGELSRQAIINRHEKSIDNKKSSIIFGTQSFSEGLDLPGDYLANLIITKIPFAVPTSPVEEAHAEYIKLKGGNAFMELTIPDASKKLVQACGRLIRKENDTGRVVILDRRLITKRYGKAMLDSLPPFKRTIEY
jgi:ATP-dependent DNA helicase DinG